MTYKEDLEPVRCGIGLFSTGPDDPFLACCEWHDKAYTSGSWAESNTGRHEVDLSFLNQMLVIAQDDPILKARAYFYYEVARAFGSKYWEGNLSS